MKRTIHKYDLTPPLLQDRTIIRTHEGACFLHVDNQYERITIWAEVDLDMPTTPVMIHIVGTGHEVPAEAERYLGTAVMAGGDYIFHVYCDEGQQ